MCACCSRLPSHISRRQAEYLVSVMTRIFRRADGAQKSSKDIRSFGFCLGEVQNEAEDLSDDVWTRWDMFSMGPREVIC
jgi:hypothetical protein